MPNWKKVIVSGSSAHLNQITGSGGVKLPDQVRLNFGDNNDLKIYHSGAHSIIQDTGTGNLELKGSIIKIRGSSTGESMAHFTENAGVELYYDSSKKLDVVTGGIDVTGHVTASGNISGSSTSTGSFGELGVGVAIPSSKLHVKGPASGVSNAPIQAQNNTYGNMYVGYGSAPAYGSGKLSLHSTADLALGTSATQVNIGNKFGAQIQVYYGSTGIGVTPPANSPTWPSGSLQVLGDISGSSTSILTMSEISSSGDIVADGDVVAYHSSDVRLKDNIEVIQGSLDKIAGIRGVEFDWNDKSPGWAQERGHDVGVIAQEVQKILPEIVTKRKNGYLGVDYKRLVPLLIESIKELRQEVNDLKKKVN